MDFIKNFEFTPINILKATGIIFAVLVVSSFAYTLMGNRVGFQALNTMGRNSFSIAQGGMASVAPSASTAYYGSPDGGDAYYQKMDTGVASEGMMAYGKGGMVTLSTANVRGSMVMPIPSQPAVPGVDAEDFEVTDYNATIETRNKDVDCSEILKLKKATYVIFENANDYDQGCNYTFKVEHSHVEKVLAIIKALDPKNLSESVYTIKRQLDDFTSESDILKKKLESIDETLKSAVKAYDEITTLATKTQNSDTLAKVIDSRINIIERLTQERINVAAQLERLERSKSDQLDRLKYTYFNVSVYENKYVDGQTIRDSWKNAVKEFVGNINTTLQGVTINLISFVFLAFQYVIYFFILVVILKSLWKVTKYIWNRE